MKYLLFPCLALPALTQVTAGTLTGGVLKTSGSAVQLAAVTIYNCEHGIRRDTVSRPDGICRFSQLPPSAYSIGGNAPNFAPFSWISFIVGPGQTSGHDKNFPRNSRKYAAERALTSLEMQQRLAASASWTITHTRSLEVRGIFTAQAGQLLSPRLRFDSSNNGSTGGTFGYDRQNVNGDPNLSNPSPTRRLLKRSARRCRTSRSGFPIRGTLPELFLDGPSTFGRVLSAKSPRQMQLSLRLQF